MESKGHQDTEPAQEMPLEEIIDQGYAANDNLTTTMDEVIRSRLSGIETEKILNDIRAIEADDKYRATIDKVYDGLMKYGVAEKDLTQIITFILNTQDNELAKKFRAKLNGWDINQPDEYQAPLNRYRTFPEGITLGEFRIYAQRYLVEKGMSYKDFDKELGRISRLPAKIQRVVDMLKVD